MLARSVLISVLILVLPTLGQAQTTQERITSIIGPVIPMGESPWPGYDDVFQANVDELGVSALGSNAVPLLGAPLSGTFTFADGCPVTVTGAGASAVTNGDWLIVAWNAVDGNGTGRFPFHNVTKVGDVISAGNRCGLAPILTAGTGITVYRCGTQCKDDTSTYKAGAWGMNSGWGGAGWNYYDFGLAVYRLYLRTSDVQYLTLFRNFTDKWWEWALDHGSHSYEPRAMSLSSIFIRALDGKPAWLPVLHAMLENAETWSSYAEPPTPPKFDAREAGYHLLFAAIGARADIDATRQADYCGWIETHVQAWINTQHEDGYWSEKNGGYAYLPPGTSPWRMFAPLQGLARAHDVLSDSTVCDNAALAADVLTAIEAGADYAYSAGRADNRGIYYDTDYPNEGQEGTNNGVKAGTVSVSLNSTAVVGVGTTFTSTFNCDGTDYIGIFHSDGYTWTFRVMSCSDNTHLVLDRNWGGAGEATTAAVAAQYYQTDAASTDCGASTAITCWSGFEGSPVPGDRNNARDLIWIHGWLYNETGATIWKTRGDELFAASYSYPANRWGWNYPGAPGACGGPACDSVTTDYGSALHACAVDPTLPCNPDHNSAPPGNNYDLMGKRFNQGSGIGGADNYLAWRLGDIAACDDGLDNDGDSYIDLADPGCESASDDDEFNAPPGLIRVGILGRIVPKVP